MKLKKFLAAIISDWLARMSGPLTVPFTIATIFAPSRYRIFFVVLASVAGLVTFYRVWLKESDRADQASARNQRPDIAGEIKTVLAGPCYRHSFRKTSEYLIKDLTALLVFVKAWNLVQMNEVGVREYKLTIEVDGKQYPAIKEEKVGQCGFVLKNPEYPSQAYESFDIGYGLGSIAYLNPTEDWVTFCVSGLGDTHQKQKIKLQLELVDFRGGKHRINGESFFELGEIWGAIKKPSVLTGEMVLSAMPVARHPYPVTDIANTLEVPLDDTLNALRRLKAEDKACDFNVDEKPRESLWMKLDD